MNGCPVINQTTAANEPDLLASTSDNHLAESLWRLSNMGCQEDAYNAIQQAVQLYKQLTTKYPTIFNSYLQCVVWVRKQITPVNVTLS